AREGRDDRGRGGRLLRDRQPAVPRPGSDPRPRPVEHRMMRRPRENPLSTSSGPDDPIFVVGVPRSGTTLLAAMLSAPSRMERGPETPSFPQLARAPVPRLLRRSGWPDAAVGFLASLTLNGEKVHDLFGLSTARIRDELAGRRPSISAMLEA